MKIPDVQSPDVTSPNPLPSAERVRPNSGLARAKAGFVDDANMLGTSSFGYAQNVVQEVISVGRTGTLVDWEDSPGTPGE